MRVPLLDIEKQYAPIRDRILTAIKETLEVQPVCNGPAVRNLEREIAEYSGCASGVGVSSGTDALLCTLMGLEISGGLDVTDVNADGRDEVITSPFTFFATAGTIWRTGARPVFVDIDPETFNIDPEKIEAAVTPRTKAIMPIHLFGQVAEMDAICEIAARCDLHVIEDAAQSIGAEHKGRRAGSFGTAGIFSFYPTKNLGTVGDAGMIVTQDVEFAERLAILRNHGQSNRYFHEWVGGNFRMDSLQAAVISVKLGYLDEWSEKRRANAALYNDLLADCDTVKTPFEREHNHHVYNHYVIRTPKRDSLREYFSKHGVGTGIYYPLSLHRQPCFASLGYKEGDFPESEKAECEVLSLPIFPELTKEQIHYVAEKIKRFPRG